MALQLLRQLNYVTDNLRSKSWEEFAQSGAPDLDFVFSVCDNAANEVCPVWPGQPMTAHSGIEDPAVFVGPEDKQIQKFKDAYFQLERRIQIFSNLPITSLDKLTLRDRLNAIGRPGGEPGTGA